MTIGELIRKYREEHSISQRQFALDCGLSNGYIAMLERGENPKTHQPIIPTIPRLQSVAAGMHITMNELFQIIDDMPVDIGDPDLSAEELQIIEIYRQLDEEGQNILWDNLRTVLKYHGKKNNAISGDVAL